MRGREAVGVGTVWCEDQEDWAERDAYSLFALVLQRLLILTVANTDRSSHLNPNRYWPGSRF